MLRWMQHRGPDDQGIGIDGPMMLGHQRLSILDLSSAGHQPMVDASGRYTLVYNGECYNYQDLRHQLLQNGQIFQSESDTEVLLHGFVQQGIDFVQSMVGMFAFAVWDKQQQTLHLVRDRLGIKPLYYHLQAGKRLVFSSEIKPLLESGVEAKLHADELSAFFSLRYVPGDATLFEGIQSLEPGCYLKITSEGYISSHRYWSLDQKNYLGVYHQKEAQEAFADLLQHSVRGCMLADVKVGSFLSGGIDSALLTAMIAKDNQGVGTFTFGMGGDIDESQSAKQIAQTLGVQNHLTQLQQDDFRYYSTALWYLEEPIGDSIIVPTYLLAQAASQHVKVVQLGEGADEIMAGYVHQLAMYYGHFWQYYVPSTFRSLITKYLKRLPQAFLEAAFPYPAALGAQGASKIFHYLQSTGSVAQNYLEIAGVFSEAEKKNLFHKDIWPAISEQKPERCFEKYWQHMQKPDFLNRLQKLDLRFWNTDYSMLRMDKLSMAHSIEARVPYLDHRLVELCVHLPGHFKIKNFQQKYLMRQAFQGKNLLPQAILQTPKKSFYLPIEKCFQQKAFWDFIQDELSPQSIKKQGILNPNYIRKLLDKDNRHLLGMKQLMLVLCFHMWSKTYLSNAWREGPAIRPGHLPAYA